MSAPRLLRTAQILKDFVNRLVGVNSKTAAQLYTQYTFLIPDAATADYDIVITDPIEVLDVVVQKQGGAGAASNTITVKNAATAITDVMDLNKADKLLTRALSIDDAQSAIAQGGTLRCSSAKSGGNAQCIVTVFARVTG